MAMMSRSILRGRRLLATALLTLATLGSAHASVMEFTLTIELNEAASSAARFDRVDGVLIGDPTSGAHPELLECFGTTTCEISSMSLDFSNDGVLVAHFDFTLEDPSLHTFTGLADGVHPVSALVPGFVYDISAKVCGGSPDTVCGPGWLLLADSAPFDSSNVFLGISWSEGGAGGGSALITELSDSAGTSYCDPVCGTLDIDVASSSSVDEPGVLALAVLGLVGLGAARRRKLAA